MNTNTIKVYEILKDYWGEKKASVVLDYLENETTIKVKKAVEDKIAHLATREDILELVTATRKDISELKTATREDILELKTVTQENISELEKDILKLETTIADKYANTIKWMFIFWVGTIGTIIAIIKLL